ncbi:MAG: lysophospholipid acyltransferase family protein [Pirellulaceae bacterium]
MSQTQAIVVIAGAVLALALLAAMRYRYRRFNLPQLFLWLAARLIVRVLWRAQQPRRWPVPPGQGVVVICNHRSSIDPFFIQTILDRPMRWMVAREYIARGLMGWFLRTCNVIPVGRGGVDTAATKAAIRFAAEGGCVGMLPEGRINTTDDFMLPVRPGAIWVALRAGVPILPCYIEGAPYRGTVTSPFFTRARVRVKFGELLDLSAYREQSDDAAIVAELTLRAVRQIAILAGQPEFQPKLAGRRWKPREGDEVPGESESGV